MYSVFRRKKFVFFRKILYNKFEEGDTMNLFSLLKNDPIIITPYEEKLQILNHKEFPFLNSKFLTMEEFMEKMTFSYSKKAFVYLVQKYEFPCEIVDIMLKNMKYVNEDHNFHELYDYQKELLDQGFVKQNPSFLNYIKTKNIFVYGYPLLNNYQKSLLKSLETTLVSKEPLNYTPSVYEFETIEEEVDFIANQIVDLLLKGIPVEKIKLGPIFSEYENVLLRTFQFYNLPLEVKAGNLYGTSPARFFLENLSDGIENAFKKLEENFDRKEERIEDIFNQILEITSQYVFCDDISTIKKVLTYEFQKTPIRNKVKKCFIESIPIERIIEDEFVFFLGCNKGNFPSIEKDDDYFSDAMKKRIGLDTSIEKNKKQKKFLQEKISSIKNLTITYKKKTAFKEYVKSPILDNFIIQKATNRYDHSHLANRLKLASYLDIKRKYGVKPKDLQLLNAYKMEDYLSYQNNFTGIVKEDLHQFLNDHWTLSYSSVDTYYRCGFRYYVNHILKLGSYEDTFAIKIGNIFHYVLSEALDGKKSSREYVEKYLKEKEIVLDAKEQFFLEKLIETLDFIIGEIHHQQKFIGFEKSLYERKISLNISEKITFVGIIDKILYDTIDGTDYVAIVDYKTGNPDIDLNRTIHGINMQLPIYMYLTKNLKEKVEIAGIYLQKILLKEVSRDWNKSLETQKQNQLKLWGYSTSDETILEKFDHSYVDSNVIKGMKKSSKGFYAYSKVLKKSQMEQLILLAEENIKKAAIQIENGKFHINPKKIGFTNIGCEFCSFRDLCYQKEKDTIILKEYKNLEFLGGEEDASMDRGTKTSHIA